MSSLVRTLTCFPTNPLCSDFTPEELARKLLMRGIQPQLMQQVQARRRLAASSAPELPPDDWVDWSVLGKVPPVRNQVLGGQDCGSW